MHGRQMLRKILAEKIELEPVGTGRDRGYKIEARSPSTGLSGARQSWGKTRLSMVAPTGIGRQASSSFIEIAFDGLALAEAMMMRRSGRTAPNDRTSRNGCPV